MEIQSTRRKSGLSNDDALRLIDRIDRVWLKRMERRPETEDVFYRSLSNGFDRTLAILNRVEDFPLLRDCRWLCQIDPKEFERVAEDAGRLLFHLPVAVSSMLWAGHSAPTEMPRSPVVYWAEAVLQLAIRDVPGSPLSRSAKCWIWGKDWREHDYPRSTVALKLKFVTGEMSREEADWKWCSMMAGADSMSEVPFWFTELPAFIAKSCSTVDWIIDALQAGGGDILEATMERPRMVSTERPPLANNSGELWRNSAGELFDPQIIFYRVEDLLEYERLYREAGKPFLPAVQKGSTAAAHLFARWERPPETPLEMWSDYWTPAEWQRAWKCSESTWRKHREKMRAEPHPVSKNRKVRFPIADLQRLGLSEPQAQA